MGGLEALVQVATEERDRLEAKASLDRNADTSRPTVRRSPELLFRSSHESPRTHLQAPAPRTPITPSLISGPLLRDSYSESSLRIGHSPETHPSKRQRQSHPHSGSDHSWGSPPSWDSSSQFTGLIGPGMKPRGQPSDVRTEIRPNLPIPSRDKQGASPAASRVSPTRERSARRQHVTEEKSFRSHVPGYREPVTSVPEEGWHVLAPEEPRSMAHQDLRSNVDQHPPLQKVSRSDLALEKQSAPPSPPPPQALFIPLEPPAPLSPALPPRRREDGLSPQTHPPSHNDILPPVTTAAHRFVKTESGPGLEESMDLTVPRPPAPQEPSVAQLDSLPPDSLITAVQDSPVILASPSTLTAHDVGVAEPLKPLSLSPTLPSPDAHEKGTIQAAQGIQSSPAISRVSLPPHEDILNPPASEQETCPPPTTASPSPRALSPAVSDFQDGVRANQPVGDRMSTIPETGTVTLVAESQSPAEISLTSSGELEAVDPPVPVPPAAEAFTLAVSDSPPRTDPSLIPAINKVKSEPALEVDIAMVSTHGKLAEQGHSGMDVDEELLSLIADDLPPRSPQVMLRNQRSSSPEDKHPPSSHVPLKQESAPDTLTPSCPSPAPSPFAINLEKVSTVSPDTTVSVRDSETSTLKLEERPTQKKKVTPSVFDLLRVLLTPTRQNSMHNPKVAPNQAVRQRRSLRYPLMVPRQRP